MEDGSPTLEVGFAINFGDAFGQLRSLDDIIGEASANAVREFNRLEAAARGVDLAGATASAKTFGSEASRAAEDARMAFNQAERAGESLSRQLEKQASTFGMTREQIRAMKVETAALAAEQQELTELAGRLRSQEAALSDAHTAQAQAIRSAALGYGLFEAAARRGAEAMREADAAAKAEDIAAQAEATRSAAFAYNMFEAAARRGAAAMREADAAAKAADVAAHDQAIRSAAFGYDMFEAAARRGAAAMREAEAAEARMATGAAALRSSIDPMFAAQQRFDSELTRAEQLLSAGAISTREYDQAIQHARDTLYSHAQAVAGDVAGVERLTTAMRGLASSGGVSAEAGLASGMAGIGRTAQGAQIEFLEMTHIARSLTEQIAAGVSPFRALTMESGRLMTAVQYGGAGVSGFVKQFASLLGIIRIVQNAELAEAATNAASQAAAIKSAATRATSSGAAAAAEIELSLAAQRLAVGDAEAAVAAARLAAAHEAQAVAATQLAVAEDALAIAQERAAAAAAASAAETSIAIGATTAVLAPLAVIAAAGFTAFKQFQSQVKDSGELTRYRDSLGLTHKEMLQLSDGVEKAGDKIKTLSDVSVTAGDVMAGLWKTIQDGANVGGSWDSIKSGAATAFGYVLEAWNITSAGITAGIYGTFNVVKTVWSNFPAVFGDLFVQGVNLAIEALNKLVKSGVDQLNGLIATVNKVPGVNVGQVDAPQIGLVDNANAGAAAKAAKTIGTSYQQAYADARKADAAFWSQVGTNAKQHAKDRMSAEAQALKDNETPKKEKKPNDHGLADSLAKLDAQIKGQWALAQAYQLSDAAAIKAEAQQKAEEQAIKHKGDIALFYEKELALAVAKSASEAAKHIADLTAQTGAQKAVNDAVAAGVLPVSQMGAALQEATEKRQLLAAIAIADENKWADQAAKLRTELAKLGQAQADNNAQANRAQVLASTGADADQMARLQLEARLIGATNEVRAVAIAQVEAEQYLSAHPGASADEAQKYIDTHKQIAAQAAQNTIGQDSYNKSLSYTADLMSLLSDRAQTIATTLSSAFGNLGSGLGQAMTAMSSYAAQQAKLDKDHQAAVQAGLSDQKEVDLYRQASQNNQLAGTAQLVGGLKSMFAEHSAGYQAMAAAEKAFAIIQAIGTIKSIAAGAAKMFSQLGIFAFPAVAAMVAVMAGFGFGGGTSTQTPPPTSADLQKTTGTGTVLGSPDDKSASIANSLALVAKNTSGDLQYSNQMLVSLKSIDASIGALAATVAKQINVSGSLYDTSKLNIGSSGSAGFLGLFSSSTTRTLYDAGITLAANTVGNIVANGISGQTYQIVQQVKKSSGFLGIGGGTKTSYSTTSGALPTDVTQSIQSVIGALETGIVTAAGAIGISGAKAMLDNFNVNIGKVSFNGLDAKGIEDQLNAIFSTVGDQMTAAVLPGIAKFQKVGEGLFETLERVASTVVAVEAEFQKLGRTSTAMSIDVDMGVAGMFDSVSDFTTAADAYFQTYYSTAEQTAAKTSEMAQVFASLNLAMPNTLSGFRALVDAQDLTTASGQQAYATLLKIAPAFADLQTAMSGAKSAADTLSEQQGLMNQLWQLQGNTAAIRAAQLAQLDPSNRALQEQVWAISDAQDAAKAAADLASAWSSVGDSIKTEIDRIRGLSDTSGDGSFASLMGQFNAATMAARGGDQDAAKNLPGLSQSLLTAAANAATSRQELDRIQAQTAASLEATYGVVTALAKGGTAPSTDTLAAAAAASQAATTPAAANDDSASEIKALRDEIAGMRSDMNAGNATIAGNTGKVAKILDNVTAPSGGEAVTVASAA